MPVPDNDTDLPRERSELLAQIEAWLEWPMVFLGIVWLVLLILELVRGLSPFFLGIGQIIWIVFIADFLLRLGVAPVKRTFFRKNWLTMIALVVPAFRALRFLSAFRALRGIRLVRIITSVNRAMRSLGSSMQRRALPYVVALTVVVTLAGAAGMYAFENHPGQQGLHGYAEALWWTAMLLTTMGSGYWPESAEGRALTLLLSLYALGILGYVAASLASFFIGQEASAPSSDVASEQSLLELKAEISALRVELAQQRPDPMP